VVLYECKPNCKVVAQDAAAPYKFVRKQKSPGRVTYKVRAYDLVGNFAEKSKVINVKPKKKRR
jgi:hypothetical protein